MTAGSVLTSATAGVLPIVSSLGRWSALGPEIAPAAAGAAASAVWPIAKMVSYVPILLPIQVTVKLVWWWNGATVGTDNFQCGVYSSANGLPVTKLVSCGSTLSAGANVVQSVDVTDTIIGPGMYFLALAGEGTTATIFRIAVNFGLHKAAGQCQETPGSFGLPTTATPVAMSGSRAPVFGFSTVTTI